MTTVEVFAPAKVNLTLHITGQRDDGYHLLDSLVVFAPARDRLVIQDGSTLSLTVEGPEAEGVPADMSNLALKAAEMVADGAGASLLLEKHLPAASGIGGGSADAAAALRGMFACRDHLEGGEMGMPSDVLLERYADRILGLGADVPMCLMSVPCRASGIGDKIEFLDLPPLPALLVNPRVPVSTAAVFSALSERENAPMPAEVPTFEDASHLIDWLQDQRNDLQAAAIATVPVIAEVLEVLSGLPDCRLARMSGSGATCFALFETQDAAIAAGVILNARYPEWWMVGGILGPQANAAIPRIS
ncbi:MAG: 4-(cytidine 5'-diphospho)-2-C-methyl-D-erythritol kinase [Pseudomonadota bacterium]